MSSVSGSTGGPTSGSRLDWGRSTERGSAFRGLTRGRGAPRGRGRASPRVGSGDRASAAASDAAGPHSKQGTSTLPPRPTANHKPSTALPHKPSLTSSAKDTNTNRSGPNSAVEPAASSPTSSRSGTSSIRKAVRNNTVPTLTVEGSAPPASPTTSRPSNRRKRSQSHTTKPQGNQHSNLAKAPSVPSHPPSSRAAASSRASNASRPASLIVKDVPPHLAKQHAEAADATSKDIDALVEHFRAGAMTDHQPATPGGRIDWADEDDTLPDLDDLGFTTTSSSIHNLAVSETTSDLISPIMMDGLRSLPEPAGVEALTPSPRIRSKLGATVETASKPEVTEEVAAPPAPQDESTPKATQDATEGQDVEASPGPEAGKSAPPTPGEKQGLAASIHAPKGGAQPQQGTKSRFTNGRNANGSFGSSGAPNGRGGSPSRFSRSGPSTPVHPRFNRGNDQELRSSVHNRTHSTPPAGAHSRTHASRPVLSGDAISRLAKTIGGAPCHGKSASLSVPVGSTSEQ